jgi:membrane associated rhomboid family serine protease
VFPLKDNIPTDRFPVVTVVLIVLNVLFYFLLQPKTGIDLSGQSLDPREIYDYAAVPCTLTGEGACRVPPGDLPPWRRSSPRCSPTPACCTSAGTCCSSGSSATTSRTPWGACASSSSTSSAAGGLRPADGVRPGSEIPTLGASGRVAGVLGGYLLLYPRARVLTAIFIILFFTFIEIPAILFLLFWFGQQALFGALDLTQPTGGGGVAYFAHIGGFVAGVALIKLFATRRSAVRRPAAAAGVLRALRAARPPGPGGRARVHRGPRGAHRHHGGAHGARHPDRPVAAGPGHAGVRIVGAIRHPPE